MSETSFPLLSKRIFSRALLHSGTIKFWNIFNSSWRILGYHRIVDPESERLPIEAGMYVRPKTFKKHLGYLAKRFKIIPLQELQLLLNEGRIPKKNTLVLTFDDGWIDFHQNAFPILKEMGIPATVFLPTSFIGTNQRFWTDNIVEALMLLKESGESSRTLLSNSSRPQNGASSSAPSYLNASKDESWQSDDRQLPDDSSNKELTSVAETLATITSPWPMIRHLKRSPTNVRLEIVSSMCEMAGLASERDHAVFLNWHQVREMAGSGISYGSHTHRHERTTGLSSKDLQIDIENSFKAFEENGISYLDTFCYPFGEWDDKSQQTLAEFKIHWALTTDQTSNLDSSPRLLGRTLIHEDISNSIPMLAARLAHIPGFI